LTVAAYYNEIDSDAAEVLQELIRDGVIAPGDVDTRSIKDVQPDDLRGYTQCHFFAGGGLWSVAADLLDGLTTEALDRLLPLPAVLAAGKRARNR
jgi:hypothetical protein